ncbi:hypothetical protein [Actinomadura chibensis]|uniref:Uncharacterized protein n=1 Tax=Actinomadura chibensis TaxID=392828 RepID=A0A5D0NTM6_9ACTN|nr:hypothetical protein [Actinomadura chibensis]TYB48040.1 hypothetical protein FXF69_02060 [Actinomadura chibensis]
MGLEATERTGGDERRDGTAGGPAAGQPLDSGDILGRLAAIDRRRLPDAAAADDLNRFADEGRTRVLVVLLASAVARLLPGRVSALTATLSVLVMAGWPGVLGLVAGGLVEDHPLRGDTGGLLVLSASVTTVLMLGLGWYAWRWAAVLAAGVSDLLAASADRRAFLAWLRTRRGLVPQLAAGAGGAVLASLLAYAMSHQDTDSVAVSAWIYVCCAWTGFIGGGVVYWLYTLAEVPLRLHRCGDLQMAWLDPAHTPAIVQLCRVYARVAVATALGVLLAEVSTVSVTSDRPGALMEGFYIGFPVLAVVTALYVGVQPYVTLAHLVRRHIDTIVDPLMAQTHRPPGHLLLSQDLPGAFQAYTHFRTLRRLPIKTATILQYVTGIMASLAVFFVQRLFT